MSIKVLIVDDEKLERVLIRKGYDWEQHGFEIIGEASSGQEALEFMAHRKPDLVMTDISMPHMDGLELADRIRQDDPECKIVIVTGYRDFDYARKALRAGVEDFLLKPVNMQDIHDVTEKIREKLSKEQRKVQEVEKLKETVLADHDILMESFFQRLVEKRISEEEAERKLVVYNCEQLMKQCVCVNIRLVNEHNEKEQSIAHKEVFHLIQKQQIEQSICFIHFMQNIIIYFTDSDMDRIASELQKLKNSMDEISIHAQFGISNQNQGFTGISKAYEESEKAIGIALLLKEENIAYYREYDEIMNKNKNSLEFNWEDFQFHLTNCLRDKTEEDISKYIDYIKTSKILDNDYLQLMTFHFVMEASLTLTKYGISFYDGQKEKLFQDKIRHCYQLEQVKDLLDEYTQIVIEYHESKKVKQGNKVVEEALTYMTANLYDPELSLHAVAAEIFSNESYLSRVFKKETGLSLIEYISKKRIEESIRLLNTTDMKVYEIAEKVGFRDSHYFSICFKKQTGRTVKEYRSGKSE